MSQERWIISMRRWWETVSNSFEMSTAMAIVLLRFLCWLKPETTLAEMGSRAEAVECLALNLYWEEGGVCPAPPQWTGGFRTEVVPIFSLPGRAMRRGGRSKPGLLASQPSLPSKLRLWQTFSKLPGHLNAYLVKIPEIARAEFRLKSSFWNTWARITNLNNYF